MPHYGATVLQQLETSLRRIREETLSKKYECKEDEDNIVVNEEAIISELEQSLHSIMLKNLQAIQMNTSNKRKCIKLGGLYEFACRNTNNNGDGGALKRYLNSFYLTSRVYRVLCESKKSDGVVEELQLRLLGVRRKIILDMYKNEYRKGKLHHLRSTKAVKMVSSIPKKLKYIARKCNKEIMKYLTKEGGGNCKQLLELKQLLVGEEGKQVTTMESVCQSVEESLIDYYGRVHIEHDKKTDGYITALREISEAQNKEGDHVLLNYCEQDMAMEYLCLNNEEVRRDYIEWDGLSEKDSEGIVNGSSEERRAVEEEEEEEDKVVVVVEVVKEAENNIVEEEEGDGGVEVVKEADEEEVDFEEFQLVDEWEDNNNNNKDDNNDDEDCKEGGPVDIADSEMKVPRRRSRFGPRSEEFITEQLKQGNLGFTSTFVDENEEEKPQDNNDKDKEEEKEDDDSVVNVIINKGKEEEEEEEDDSDSHSAAAAVDVVDNTKDDDDNNREDEDIFVVAKREAMFDVVAGRECCEVKVKVKESAGEVCKTVLRKLEERLRIVLKEGGGGGVRDRGIVMNREAEAVTKEVFGKIKRRMEGEYDRVRRKKNKSVSVSEEVCSPKEAERPKAYSTVQYSKGQQQHRVHSSRSSRRSRSPPVVLEKSVPERHVSGTVRSKHSDGDKQKEESEVRNTVKKVCSPERARYRAMVLSYKRDVVSHRGKVVVTPAGSESTETAVTVGTVKTDCGGDQQSVATAHSEEGDAALPPPPPSSSLPSLQTAESDVVAESALARPSKVQWLAVHPDNVVSIPLPTAAAPFLENIPVPPVVEGGELWAGRKVFVVDGQEPKDQVAVSVRQHLLEHGACVFDSSNYKQAGKGLHVLVHNDWRFPDPCVSSAPLTSPVSLLFLKNNSGVHFLSYPDLETVVKFQCSTVFPHSRSCLFLDHQSLVNTHPDNVRNMLDFMIKERETSDRVWCLKIVPGVYKYFTDKIKNGDEVTATRLSTISSILEQYSSKFSEEDSLSLVEVVGHNSDGGTETLEGDESSQQEQVLSQQYFLQRKFRHFCILTDSLNTTELDIRFLSTYGIALLPLRTFLTNKIKTFIE